VPDSYSLQLPAVDIDALEEFHHLLRDYEYRSARRRSFSSCRSCQFDTHGLDLEGNPLGSFCRTPAGRQLRFESGHPPVFIWTTADDALVPFTHSKLFAEACGRAHVPVEFTLFPHGPHGMGLALDAPNEARGWTTTLLVWLAQQWGEPQPTRSARVDETGAIREERHQG
jgi:acetyl esterase/lipase